MKYLGSYISPELGTWLQTAAAVFAPREAVAEETPEAATAQWEHLLARHDVTAEDITTPRPRAQPTQPRTREGRGLGR